MKKKVVIIFLILVIISLPIGIGTVAYYHYNNNSNKLWTITAFGNKSDNQMMAFTIEGDANGLVIIDGGYNKVQEEVDTIVDVIRRHNNVVDAWIITHLDSDHVGVYLNVIENHPEIKINKVYTANIPELEKAKEKAPWENDWSNYEKFVAQKKKVDNIECLSEGDYIEDIIGLKMDVLWSYSDWVYENSTNLLNNGGLVFKLIGNNESMLIFADIQDEKIGNLIIDKYSHKLNADYVQIAHHGNNSLPDKIYDEINPKMAFIPAPDWIFENPNKIAWFTADKIRDLLIKKGVIVYSDKNYPLSIVME